MDRRHRLDELHLPDNHPWASTTIVYTILAIYIVHQLLVYFDYPILSPQELFWNGIVYITPARLLLDAEKRQELTANNMLSQTHAAKGEAMRRTLGFSRSTLTHKLSGGEGIMRRMSMFSSNDDAPTTDAPPGLGNWDNSCYQNSVLQGLASLQTLRTYLMRTKTEEEDADSTSGSLRETVAKLNDISNNGKQLWTPAKLKSMSSWQQQDAQEYFSKIMDELDKEAAKAVSAERRMSGLEVVAQDTNGKEQDAGDAVLQRNPMEGLLAQRVACTRCGFSEGLSMIPFNCLTVPLGSDFAYDLKECLDEYTKLEEINEVQCAKCTLLRVEGQLQQLLPVSEDTMPDEPEFATKTNAKQTLALPPEVRVLVAKRLQTVQQALEDDDFSDRALNETCQIPKKTHVSSTKTRQAVVGRAPQSLVVHVNRSVFDESTGVQRKNYASVRYPMVLDLSAWMLGQRCGESATQSMLSNGRDEPGCLYRLMAVVTHYGRHENGHYICYRKHSLRSPQDVNDLGDDDGGELVQEKWWRLSDEDVSPVTEQNLLDQGGVFMLFYEHEDTPQRPATADTQSQPVITEDSVSHTDHRVLEEAAAIPLPPDMAAFDQGVNIPLTSAADIQPLTVEQHTPPAAPQTADSQPSTDVTTGDESEAMDHEEPASLPEPMQQVPSPPLMRTARGRHSSRQSSRSEAGFANTFRPMAAT